MIFTHHVKIEAQASIIKIVKFVIFFILLFPTRALCDVRNDNLYKSPKVRQFFAIGGYYQSDQSAKDKEFSFVYGIKSNKNIFEIEGLSETWIREQSKVGWVKTRNLYDIEISNKSLLGETNNYLLLNHHTRHDSLSNYYYDISNAVGLGKRLFNEKWDVDLSLGYADIKNSGYKTTLNIGSKLILNLTEKLRLIQRTVIYSDLGASNSTLGGSQLITDNYDIGTALSYKIDEHLRLEFYHTYEKDTYRKTTSKQLKTYTVSDRKYTIKLRFDF